MDCIPDRRRGRKAGAASACFPLGRAVGEHVELSGAVSPGFTDTSCFVEREVAALQQAAGAATYLGGLNPASILASLLPRK